MAQLICVGVEIGELVSDFYLSASHVAMFLSM